MSRHIHLAAVAESDSAAPLQQRKRLRESSWDLQVTDEDSRSCPASPTTAKKARRFHLAGAGSLLERTTSTVARATSTVSQAFRRQDRRVKEESQTSSVQSALPTAMSSTHAKEAYSVAQESRETSGSYPRNENHTRTSSWHSALSSLPVTPLKITTTEHPTTPIILPSPTPSQLEPDPPRLRSFLNLSPPPRSVSTKGDGRDFSSPFSPSFDPGYANPLRDSALRYSPSRPASSCTLPTGDDTSPASTQTHHSEGEQCRHEDSERPLHSPAHGKPMHLENLIHGVADQPTSSYGAKATTSPQNNSGSSPAGDMPVRNLFRPHPAPRERTVTYDEQSDMALGDSDIDDWLFEDAVRRANTLRIMARYENNPHDPNLPQPHETGRYDYETSHTKPSHISDSYGPSHLRCPEPGGDPRSSFTSSTGPSSHRIRTPSPRSDPLPEIRHWSPSPSSPVFRDISPPEYEGRYVFRPSSRNESRTSLGTMRSIHSSRSSLDPYRGPRTAEQYVPASTMLDLFTSIDEYVKGNLRRAAAQREQLRATCGLASRCLRITPEVDKLVGRLMGMMDQFEDWGGDREWEEMSTALRTMVEQAMRK